MKKLTLISILFRGRLHSRFVMARVDADGRTCVDPDTLGRLLDQIGVQRGQTYSMG